MGNSQMRTPNVIMLGLDGSGKTTLLYKLLAESAALIESEDVNDDDRILSSSNSPKECIYGTTIGFNVEIIGQLKVTDVGGSTAMRSLWKNYFHGMRGIIFIFDSSDIKRIKLCKNVLHFDILGVKQLKCLPLLIYSNKTDESKLNDKQQIIDILQLNKIKHRHYHIEIVSAINNDNMFNLDGLLRGYKWLTNEIIHHQHNQYKISSNDDEIPHKKPAFNRSRSTGNNSLFNINWSLYSNNNSSRKSTRAHKRSSSIGAFIEKFMSTDKNGKNDKNGAITTEPLKFDKLQNKEKENSLNKLSLMQSTSKPPGLKAVEEMDDSTLFFFMIGLNGSGKTTIIYHLKYGHFYSVSSNISYDSIQFLKYNGINIGIYECDPFRAGKLMKDNIIVKNHENRINGLIFVMDGNENDKFDEIKTMLTNCVLLKNDNEIPLLIIVNTKNNEIAMSRKQVIQKLDIFTTRKVEYKLIDIIVIKYLYDDIIISDGILKMIINYLPKTETIQFKDESMNYRDCSLYFMNGFSGIGIQYAMNWMLSNAKCTHSQKLNIALNVLSNDNNKKNNKKETKFHGDRGDVKYVSTHDYLHELMDQDDDDEMDTNTIQQNLSFIDVNESIISNANFGSITTPINKRIW